jgi:hypothetical protein
LTFLVLYCLKQGLEFRAEQLLDKRILFEIAQCLDKVPECRGPRTIGVAFGSWWQSLDQFQLDLVL